MLKKRGQVKGYKMSEEQKQKISRKLRGIKKSEETREKMKMSHIGVKKDEETRRKMSEKKREQWRNGVYGQEFSEKISRALKKASYLIGKTGEQSPAWKGGPVGRKCLICGNNFEVNQVKINRGNGLYCSKSCAGKSRFGETASNWQGGKSFEPYCEKFNEVLKESIRNRDNRRCLLCEKSEILEGKKLAVHHIDGDKLQGCNNKQWALVTLCQSCHSKSTTIEQEFLIISNLNIMK